MYAYAQVARALAGVYLVMQLVVLLDFIYRLNNSLIDREGCVPVLVTLTAGCYVTGLVGIGFQYHMFAPSASCGLNIFLITFTLVLGVASGVVSVLPKRSKDSGLFTASAVFLYAVFLSFSALNSEPNSTSDQCERYAGTQTNWITARHPSSFPGQSAPWSLPILCDLSFTRVCRGGGGGGGGGRDRERMRW